MIHFSLTGSSALRNPQDGPRRGGWAAIRGGGSTFLHLCETFVNRVVNEQRGHTLRHEQTHRGEGPEQTGSTGVNRAASTSSRLDSFLYWNWEYLHMCVDAYNDLVLLFENQSGWLLWEQAALCGSHHPVWRIVCVSVCVASHDLSSDILGRRSAESRTDWPRLQNPGGPSTVQKAAGSEHAL